MEIGGSDLVVNIGDTPKLRICIRRFFRKEWPRSVMQSVVQIDSESWFIFKTLEDETKWENISASPEAQDAMVQVSFEDVRFTVVCHNEPGCETRRLAKSLIDHIFAEFLPQEASTAKGTTTKTADEIVKALVACDPIYNEVLRVSNGTVINNPTCILCSGEIPNGHTKTCPWLMAERYVRECTAEKKT